MHTRATPDLSAEPDSSRVSRLSRTSRAPDASHVLRISNIPPINRPLVKLFSRYTRSYLRRHFHGVRVAGEQKFDALEGWPLLVVMNHPSWWDPLIGFHLARHFLKTRVHHAPMEGDALERYRFFGWLGLFGVQPGTVSGTKRFLSVGSAVLTDPGRALWVTVQGRFADARERPVELRAGIGHLVHRLQRCAVLPLALEYVYWNERLPEALARFGQPQLIHNGAERMPAQWTEHFAQRLADAQDALAADAMSRDLARFQTLIAGGAGVNKVYDLWRSAAARLRGQRIEHEHSPAKRFDSVRHD